MHTHICIYIHMHMYRYIFTHTFLCVYTYTYRYKNIHIDVDVCVYVHIFLDISIKVQIYKDRQSSIFWTLTLNNKPSLLFFIHAVIIGIFCLKPFNFFFPLSILNSTDKIVISILKKKKKNPIFTYSSQHLISLQSIFLFLCDSCYLGSLSSWQEVLESQFLVALWISIHHY